MTGELCRTTALCGVFNSNAPDEAKSPCVRLLLEAKAEVNLAADSDFVPLHFACGLAGNPECARLLLDASVVAKALIGEWAPELPRAVHRRPLIDDRVVAHHYAVQASGWVVGA